MVARHGPERWPDIIRNAGPTCSGTGGRHDPEYAFSEQIIDKLYPQTALKKKPRTYRQKARKAYLAVAKRRRPGGKVMRRGIKQQLQYLRRNLKHIEGLLAHWPVGTRLPLPRWLLHRYWVIQHVYAQQWQMYCDKVRRCDDRIVNISQPYVRPIVRGKQSKSVEFGAKLSVSLSSQGLARVDRLRWDAFHEGGDLQSQVEDYRRRYGYYPEKVLGDPLYGTRENRRYLKHRGIHFAGRQTAGTAEEGHGCESARAEALAGTATRGVPATHSDRRQVRARQERLSAQLHSCQTG